MFLRRTWSFVEVRGRILRLLDFDEIIELEECVLIGKRRRQRRTSEAESLPNRDNPLNLFTFLRFS